MPLRQFQCTNGHVFEALVRLDGSDAPSGCVVATQTAFSAGGAVIESAPCGLPVERVMSAPASHFPGADTWRRR